MHKIYGMVGWIGSGKDTAADYLVQVYGFKKVSYATNLKDAVAAVFGWQRDLLEGNTAEGREWRETVDTWWSRRLEIQDFTPRKALQYIGTELFRNYFHPDIWIAGTERAIAQHLSAGHRVVTSDCRFPNEISSIQSLGGALVRIRRNNELPSWFSCAQTQNTATPSELVTLRENGQTMEQCFPQVHASEWSWVGRKTQYDIDNSGSRLYLYQQLDAIGDDLR